jgi:hypothetical protein
VVEGFLDLDLNPDNAIRQYVEFAYPKMLRRVRLERFIKRNRGVFKNTARMITGAAEAIGVSPRTVWAVYGEMQKRSPTNALR